MIIMLFVSSITGKIMNRAVLIALVIGWVLVSGASTYGQAPAAAQNGKVSICREIDDDWKCVGESAEWKANEPFDVLFVNPKRVAVDFIGIVIHKQEADGKDGDMVNEYQQNIGEENRKYATVGGNFRLPAGTYTIYIISWGKRETMYHKGNFTDYFAKTTIRVK